uniref:Uncharacterized protein n=1 Tax=Panagrolaimus sp. ES5 TaxID=591445 RepID=A0AC34GBE5_9BILA
MYDPGRGYGRKNVQQMFSVLYPPGPVNPGSYIQPQQTPYPSSQQQQIPIPITNNYPQTQQISKPQQPQIPINNPYQHSKPQSSSQQPRSSSPPPPYS